MESLRNASIHYIGHAGAIGPASARAHLPEEHTAEGFQYNNFSLAGLFAALNVSSEDVIDRAALTYVYNGFAALRPGARPVIKNGFARSKTYSHVCNPYWLLNKFGGGFLSRWSDLNSNALIVAAICDHYIQDAEDPEEFRINGLKRLPVSGRMIERARKIWEEATHLTTNGLDRGERPRYEESHLLSHITSLEIMENIRLRLKTMQSHELEDAQTQHITPALSLVKEDTPLGQKLQTAASGVSTALMDRMDLLKSLGQYKPRRPRPLLRLVAVNQLSGGPHHTAP